MNRRFQKILAFLLAIVLTASLCPVVHAENGNTLEFSDVKEGLGDLPPIVETEPSEESEPTEEPEISEVPEEPVEEPEFTEEPTDEDVVEDGEEEDPAELPYGLPGMPEDYVLSETVLAEKAILADELAKLAELTPGVDYVENEVLTMASSEDEAALIAAAFNGEVTKFRHGMVTITLLGCTVLEAVTAAADLELPLPAVQPNYITMVDPIYSDSTTVSSDWLPTEQTWENWVLENMTNPDEFLWDPYYNYTYQWQHDAVDTYGAWGVSDGSGVVVAVIDSGVDASHPDLGGRVYVRNIGCGTAPEGDHATHVAGVIAAEMNNGIGGAGIAPEATILSYRVSDNYGGMYSDDIIDAIYDAVDSGAWIINMSFGGSFYNYYEQQAINYAYANGVTCIAAMGNDGTNSMQYPAAYNHVIAVTASDRNNGRAWFSNYGNWSDVSAPGVDIVSTVPGGYDLMDGTSMAAPVVSGLAALYMSSVGWVHPDTMEKVLESSMVNGVVNGAKMFRADKTAPVYTIETTNGYYQLSDFGKNAIPCESYLLLGEQVYDQSSVIIYTVDGKNPSIKNGQIVNGQYYDRSGIDLSQYSGKTVTIKAARVTGMGVLSKALTLKLKVAASTQIDYVYVEGPNTLIAGKSDTFKAVVYPKETANQNVTWSIVDCSPSMKGATINSKGKLTTVAGCEGYVVVQAKSVANPSYCASKHVEVHTIKPVAKIVPSSTKITVGAGYSSWFTYELKDANGNWIDPGISGVEFISSNPAVVQVYGDTWQDGTGYLQGMKKGTATITIRAQDGSGKTAKINITVTQPVESLNISGQGYIAPGSSATFKATAYPSTANNKKVTWSLINAPAGVTVNASGVVKVASNVATGKYFTVRAYAADGYGAYVDYQVCTTRKSSKIYVTYDNYSDSDSRPVWKNGNITSVELYSVDRPDYMAYDESSIILYGYGSNGTPGKWTSNSDVVSIIDDNGYCYVYAQKPGTAKLTCALQDGSGKKATVTVKVVTPSSRVSIHTTAPRMTNAVPYVAMGKNISFTATLADTYGTPTNKKVTWDVSIYEVDSSGNVLADWTDFFLSNKLCTFSGGKLSVKKGVLNYWYGITYDFMAEVRCNDAYGNWAYQDVYIIPPTTKITPQEQTVYMPSDYCYYVYFESDQWNPGYNALNNAFTATSSKPDVAGVGGISSCGNGWYELMIISGKPGTKGKATITITAADSGKTSKITVNVNDKYW